MKSNIRVIILFLFVLLSACNRIPKDVLSEEKMSDVLFEIHLSEGTFDVYQFSKYSDAKKHYYKYLLDKQGVSLAQFDTSISWYSNHLDVYERVYENVLQKLKDRQKEVQEESYPFSVE
jgi:hypothetical protein